jgi:hypothetical protein
VSSVSSGQATLKRGGSRRASTARAAPTRAAPKVPTAQFRELLDRTLSDIDADPSAGSLLRATGLRIRLRFPDAGLALNLAPSEDAAHHLRWTFSDRPPWEPKLELTMSSQVANVYLQGGESLAIAIARGRVRYRGDARCALQFLPAMRIVVDAYRRLVREHHPELAV